MLQRALKEREIQVLTSNQKILFLFEALQKSEAREIATSQKLSKEQERFEGKEFLMEKVKESLNFHKERADIMRCKLQFFECLNPSLLARINDDQIEALQNHYSYLQERLKEEKARRIYKNKIDALKQQIKMLRRNDESLQSELQRSSFLKSHQMGQVEGMNSFFQSQQQSQTSQLYLQLLGDQRSFQDSLLTQDDQSHFQKFAADNHYFQKIFSQLFLGGEKAKKTNEDESKKLEESSQKILDDISCLADDPDVADSIKQKEDLKAEEEQREIMMYPSTKEGCDAFLKNNNFEPSQRIKKLIEKQTREIQFKKRLHESEVQSNRPVAAEEVITLPSDMICSPRLLPVKGQLQTKNNTDVKVLNRSAGDAWERALELEIKKLDFDKRIRQKFSEEGGTRLRETRLAFSRPEKASPSPVLNFSFEHSQSTQKLLRPQLIGGFRRPEQQVTLPSKALKIYPSARLDRISPKCGTPVHISSTLGTGGKNSQRSDPYDYFERGNSARQPQLSKKQSGKLPSPAGELALQAKKGRVPEQTKMLKNLILSENFEKQHKYPLTPTAQTSKRSSFKVFGVQKKR